MPRPRRLLLLAWSCATLVAFAGVGVAVVAHEAAERLVHPPREQLRATPAGSGLPYESVALLTDDDVRLSAWWMPAEEPLGTVVFLHGYGASKTQGLPVFTFLHAAGFNVLAFDFRAHGYSGGTMTTFGLDEVQDVAAAMDYLRGREDVDPDRIALFGWSMGGATALHAATRMPEVRAVVADSSFARLDDVVGRSLSSLTGLPRWPFVPAIALFASHMTHRDASDNQPERSAGELRRPLLLIQGVDDALAQPSDGVALARAAGPQARLWLVEAGHVDARHAQPQAYERHVVRFLLDAFAAAPAAAQTPN